MPAVKPARPAASPAFATAPAGAPPHGRPPSRRARLRPTTHLTDPNLHGPDAPARRTPPCGRAARVSGRAWGGVRSGYPIVPALDRARPGPRTPAAGAARRAHGAAASLQHATAVAVARVSGHHAP